MVFSNLTDKWKKAYRLQSYDDVLLNTVSTMIEYEGLPDTIDDRFIEIYRLIDGAVAIWKNEGDWICSEVSFGGKPDVYGIGTLAICSTKNGVVKQFENWRTNPNIAIIFNSKTLMPDMNIGRFSDMFTETETSILMNIIFSRLYPMPVVDDEKVKKAIDTIFDDIKTGKISSMRSILDNNAIKKLTDGTNTGIDLVNITDVKNSDKIQYLAKFRDDLFRWFYSLYGMNSQGSAKMAQQTVDEVNQDNNASMILPHDRYHEALKGAKMCNEKFGWDVKVSFSECWQSRLAACDEEFSDNKEEIIVDNKEVENTDEIENEEEKEDETE